MNEYRPKASRIVRGIILLLVGLAAMWFTADVFWVYTPLYDALEGEYVRGEITEIKKTPSGDSVQGVYVKYKTGTFAETVEGLYPAPYFYRDGLEAGDKIPVPRSKIDSDDMNLDERRALVVLLLFSAVFIIWGSCVLGGAAAEARYFRRLFLDKKYVEAKIVRSLEHGKKIRADCAYEDAYGDYKFQSKYYPRDRYHFKRGGTVRVYVDLEKNPDKYLVSEK